MKRNLSFLLFLVPVLGLASGVGAYSAQRPAATPAAAPVGGMTLTELLDKYAAALGGRDRLAAVKTVRMTGTMTTSRQPQGAPITVEKKRDGKYLRTLVTEGITVVQGVDAGTVWELDPGMGIAKPQPMDATQSPRFRHRADFDGPLLAYKAKGYQVELLGKDSVDGAEAYKVAVHYKEGDYAYWLIDAKTFLPVREVEVLERKGRALEIPTTYKDFRVVNGVKWPFDEETAVHDFSQHIVWNKVEVNVPLNDDKFKMAR